MPPALRLVVIWMVGALALAVGWCVRVHEARSAGPQPAGRASDLRAEIAATLRDSYFGDDRLKYTGASIVEVRDPRLQCLLPGTTFFKTWLRVGEAPRPDVCILISFRYTRAGDRIIRAGVFTMDTGETYFFLEQFLGITAPDEQVRRELAFGLASLIATTAASDEMRVSPAIRVSSDSNEARATLAWDEARWRDVRVITDGDGRVSRVAADVIH